MAGQERAAGVVRVLSPAEALASLTC